METFRNVGIIHDKLIVNPVGEEFREYTRNEDIANKRHEYITMENMGELKNIVYFSERIANVLSKSTLIQLNNISL